MAGLNRIVALDVGASTVKVAEFQIPKEGFLSLMRFGVADLGLDPNKEEDRSPVVTRTVIDLLKQTGIRPGPAYFAVPGNSVFMRFVKLPPVDAIQVEQMIGFEAQQNVPFPIEDVIWDYQFMSSRAGGGETEAVIAAMKADLIETENRAIEAAGLSTQLIDVAPLALYNSYRYNYPEEEGCTLLVDIGARTTNLLFIEKRHLYTRGIPIAGNLISQNICNEFQEPFAAAETLKKGKGFVSLGGAYADPDDRDAARISKIVRMTMTRLHNEINRSISFYRTQQGGSAPKRVVLTGGSSQMAYVDVFLAEKLNLPVEFFNPFRNVSLAQGINTQQLTRAAHSMGEVVGLALRAATHCPFEVKLNPPALRDREVAAKRRPFMLAALVVWMGLFALLAGEKFRELIVAQGAVGELKGKVERLSALEAQIVKLEKEEATLAVATDAAGKLEKQRKAWIDFLKDLNSRIPTGVWITQLNPTYNGQPLDAEVTAVVGAGPKRVPAAGGAPAAINPGFKTAPEINQIFIKGLFEASQRPEIINRFALALSQSEWFDIDPKKISEVIISVDSTPEAPQLALNFNLSLKLKKPIDLTP